MLYIDLLIALRKHNWTLSKEYFSGIFEMTRRFSAIYGLYKHFHATHLNFENNQET